VDNSFEPSEWSAGVCSQLFIFKMDKSGSQRKLQFALQQKQACKKQYIHKIKKK